MLLWTVLLIIIFIILFLFWEYGIKPYRSLAHIPGPKHVFFRGNVADFKNKAYFNVHAEYVKKYGPVSKYFSGPVGQVLIADPKLIKELTVSNFDTFHNRPSDPRRLRPNTSLLVVRDEYWRRIRRTISPTFNAVQMKQMIPHIMDQLDVFLNILEGASSSAKSINIHSLVGCLTLDIIGSIAFGAQLNTQRNEDNKLVKLATAIIRRVIPASQDESVLKKAAQMFPFLVPLVKLFPPNSDTIALEDANKLDSYSHDLLTRRREKNMVEKDVTTEESTRKNFLDLLLSATDPETGNELTDREILDQSNLFLLAGHETTSNLISYTIFLLAQYTEVDEELSKECRELSEISYQSIRDMKLMTMVLKESLRLFPPAVLIRREADADTNLGGYHIPKGVPLSVPIWALHYDESHWKDPTAFKPERWSTDKGKEHAFHWMPFGAGPHGCIGERFAMMEAALVLLQVLKKFRFTLEPGQVPLELEAGVTVTPKHGIHVLVHPRELSK